MTVKDSSGEELQSFGLQGKVAIVTGAASGIGEATAELFVKVGARVVVADLNLEGAEEVAARLSAYGDAVAAECDVSDEGSVIALFEQARDRFGLVDVLINNAAYRPKAPFMTMPVDEWDKMHSVIARGTFLCTREAVKHMREHRRGGSIVNISSVSAVRPTILNNAHYDSAKGGVEGLTRATAYEFAPDGIRVNAIRPGGTDTAGPRRMRAAGVPPPAGPFSMERVPLGHRPAQPAETAKAILFLASPASSYITGEAIAVDGGFLIG